MAVGARDYIDQALVKKYSTMQVDNHEGNIAMVSPEKMMSAMSDYAAVSRNMFTLNQKLSAACSAVNAIRAQYRQGAA